LEMKGEVPSWSDTRTKKGLRRGVRLGDHLKFAPGVQVPLAGAFLEDPWTLLRRRNSKAHRERRRHHCPATLSGAETKGGEEGRE